MKARKPLLLLFGVFVIIFFLYLQVKQNDVRESMIYFPIDNTVHFTGAVTELMLTPRIKNDAYELEWKIFSDLDKKIYLRQDIGLLYKNGKLIEVQSKWKEQAKELLQVKQLEETSSGYYKAISFHHGEIHYQHEVIKSAQMMSNDHLYVADTSGQGFTSFRTATTAREKEEKKKLDSITKQQLQQSWETLLHTYQIPLKEYHLIPLTELWQYNDKPLPDMTMEETAAAIGRLWEGIYKNYFLGLKRQDGTIVSPIGSAIPIILVNKHHIIILIEAQNGETFQLLQHT